MKAVISEKNYVDIVKMRKNGNVAYKGNLQEESETIHISAETHILNVVTLHWGDFR